MSSGLFQVRLASASTKKLSSSITRSQNDLPTGWGIYIIEGPDTVNIIFTIICMLLAFLVLSVAYAAKTKDISAASGVGSFLVTALTLLCMAMKIEQWKAE